MNYLEVPYTLYEVLVYSIIQRRNSSLSECI